MISGEFQKKGNHMRATEINNIAICKTHCDWIADKAKNIETIKNSLSELQLYVESL